MNKSFIILSLSTIIMISGAALFSFNTRASVRIDENIVALTQVDSNEGETCYNTIQAASGIKTLYCPECRYIKGEHVSWSSTDVCYEIVGEGEID